ncbi:hypothetical protein H9Q13_00105 [Pontibacter sp. JH31]|uniref:DUF4625 domain-containing protein n=1 Tax=Pontibacter aquaedesilientis TaxID=2766980 RepID=A0ABR7XB68_9BACT|nr:hypothetical protein [Pontibacter aquaedesilientis]MBD1395553.1 hypothetical protein [Pontibacter aquaedesilientis]
MKLKTWLASLAAISFMTACEDLFEDGSLQPDGSKPNLTVKNPTANQTLATSKELRIKLTATDKDKIKALEVRVHELGGNAELVNFTTFPDKKILEVDTLLTVPGLRTGEYMLTISATDFRTNVASKEVGFKVKSEN